MPEKHYKVEVQEDHLERLANGRPLQAISELIWNGLDADATQVDVIVDSNDFGMQSIVVRDNGDGIPYEEAPHLFANLGGSWKAQTPVSRGDRLLHGKDGKGRFKALALGRVADWTVTLKSGENKVQYTITLIRDNLVDVRVTEPIPVKSVRDGVEVKITELYRDYRSLKDEIAIQELSETFAIYLSDYTDVSISYQGKKLDPSASIKDRIRIDLDPIADEGEEYSVELELIEWNTATERVVYLCGAEGFPLQRLTPRFHTPGHQFSAYIKSSFISELQKRGLLELAEMTPVLQSLYEEVQERIKQHFKELDAEAARSEIEKWKAEDVYPYTEEPKTVVEEAERKVFDIVALNVSRQLPEFSESDPKSKAFQFRMLRQAVERGPDELQLILKEVLDLPERKQRELAKLLEEASLSNIIGASKLVTDRLKFIRGLETLLFDPNSKMHLKERSQLHRILADNNTWVFGEEFNLTVSDQSLTEVLRQHQRLIGDEIAIDKPVKRVDGSRGIIDLMLSRSVPQNHSDEREHLVVELKRPSVKIGADEITQIKKYAFAVADDERFRHLKTQWNFWVISNDLDDYAKRETRQQNQPKGLIFATSLDDGGIIQIWVKTWSEILAECTSRLQFVQNHLQADINKENSLNYLRRTYEKYLQGIAIDGEETEEESFAEEATEADVS